MIGLCIVPLVFSVALLSVAHYLLDKDIELQKERGDYLLVFSLIISVFIVLFLLIYAYLVFSGSPLTARDTGNFDVLYYIVYLAMIGLFNFVSLFTYGFFTTW